MLGKGIPEWNRWRWENPDVIPDLSGANLSRQWLPTIDFRRANLSNAALCGAYLVEANLWSANLTGCNLGNLTVWRSTTDMESGRSAGHMHFVNDGVDFSGGILAEAILAGAQAGSVLFKNTNLDRTNFYKTSISECMFIDCDLSNTDFRHARFAGYSTVDPRTLRRSKSLSREFLRGCGLPEAFIAYLPSLLTDAFQFYSCFISYSHADKLFAERLHDRLQAVGIRCWRDERQLLAGDDIYDQVDRGIRFWDKTVLCCSQASLTSWWVDNEIGTAFEKEQKLTKDRGSKVQAIIPLDLDGYLFGDAWQSGYSAQIRRRLAADFRGWEQEPAKFEQGVQSVIRALRADEHVRQQPPVPKL
jgi:hypothetical protein